MGNVLEVVSAFATAPGAGPTALTAATGDTLAVRNFDPATPAYLLNQWGNQATAGFVQVRSPRFHDNTRGIRTRVLAATVSAELPMQFAQHLYPQDAPVFECGGGGAGETDSYGFLVYYQDAPGMAARLASWDQVKARIANLLTIELPMPAPAAVGQLSAGLALNGAGSGDLTKANTDYAVLGYLTDTACTAIGIRGPDTGNVRIGGPGSITAFDTRNWFIRLSNEFGVPCIPILNSANKGATIVSQANAAAAGTPNVDLIVAELRPGA